MVFERSESGLIPLILGDERDCSIDYWVLVFVEPCAWAVCSGLF